MELEHLREDGGEILEVNAEFMQKGCTVEPTEGVGAFK